MPKNKDKSGEGSIDRRSNRRIPLGDNGSTPSPQAPSSDDGKFDREAGRRRSEETGEVINPSHFKSRLEWQEYYDALPQSFKKGYRDVRGGNERNRNNFLSRGGHISDLGITDEKEHGRAASRRMSMHNLDKSFGYDWENGVKYNVATSDDATYNKPVPIEDWEWKEKAEIDKYGATPEGYERRLQDSTRNTLNTWSQANQGTGKLNRGPDGKLRAMNSRGEWVIFDDFGRAIGNPDIAYDDQTGRWDSLKGIPANGVTNPTAPGQTVPGLPTPGGSAPVSSFTPNIVPKPTNVAPTQQFNMPAPMSNPAPPLIATPGTGNAFGLNLRRQTGPSSTPSQINTPQQTMPGQPPVNPFRRGANRLSGLGIQ